MKGKLVYSTDWGEMCPGCRKPVDKCTCPRKKTAVAANHPPKDGIVRVSRETKGRKGKGVTIITGLPLNEAKLAQLATELKRKCGSGGTLRDGVIEIQGDHRDAIVSELQKLGYVVKRAGG